MTLPEGADVGAGDAVGRVAPVAGPLFEPRATAACCGWRAEDWRKRMEWPSFGWEWCGSKGLVLRRGSCVLPGLGLERSTDFRFTRRDLLGHREWLPDYWRGYR